MGNIVAPSGIVNCGMRAHTKILLVAEVWAPADVSISDLAMLEEDKDGPSLSSLGGEKVEVGPCSRAYSFSHEDDFLRLSPLISFSVNKQGV